jgi:CMP-2-keto-3-deoxyoctulosonic acid synthetase
LFRWVHEEREVSLTASTLFDVWRSACGQNVDVVSEVAARALFFSRSAISFNLCNWTLVNILIFQHLFGLRRAILNWSYQSLYLSIRNEALDRIRVGKFYELLQIAEVYLFLLFCGREVNDINAVLNPVWQKVLV